MVLRVKSGAINPSFKDYFASCLAAAAATAALFYHASSHRDLMPSFPRQTDCDTSSNYLPSWCRKKGRHNMSDYSFQHYIRVVVYALALLPKELYRGLSLKKCCTVFDPLFTVLCGGLPSLGGRPTPLVCAKSVLKCNTE